jgi:hypothetical protein
LIFAELKNDELNSNPKTRQRNAEVVAAYPPDKFFPKFLKMEESNFVKSLFQPKDMFMLLLLGLSDAELIQLLEHPISFKEQGPGNRHSKIDVWLRKAAVLSLSREFKDDLCEKLACKQPVLATRLVASFAASAFGRLPEKPRFSGQGVTLSDYTESTASSAANRTHKAAAPSEVLGATPRAGGGIELDKQLVVLITTLNENQKEVRRQSTFYCNLFSTKSLSENQIEERTRLQRQ